MAAFTLRRSLPDVWSFWTADQVSQWQLSSLSAHWFVVHDGPNGYFSAAWGTQLLFHGDPNSKSTRGKIGLYRVKFVVGTE